MKDKDLTDDLENGVEKKNKGGRPSHTPKPDRKRLNISISKNAVLAMDQFLLTDAGRVARNRSHLFELAVLDYVKRNTTNTEK